jgi:DNA primase catalytic core
MSNITEWIKEELYPSLFERIDTALPEHQFKRTPKGWRSKTYLDGSPHKHRVDKTIINKKAIGYIFEQGGKPLSLIDYVMGRDGVEFIQAVKTLADVVGLQLPTDPNFNKVDYQSNKDKATILEDCNSYFVYYLEHSPEAEGVKDYLTSRGYSKEDVEAMELGYIPSQDKLYTYLTKVGKYDKSLVDEAVKLHKGIGSTHKLTIPFRSGSNIKGFVVRTTVGADPKYLVSTGLRRGESLFNMPAIKGERDLVIVEGYLDALISEARGVENIVALGGAKLTTDQVKDAVRKGVRSFTLCLDTDDAGKEGILQSIELILAEGVKRIYVTDLSKGGEGKIDPDSFIKEQGVEAFKQAIKESLPYYEYKLQLLIDKYVEIELTPRDIDNFLDEVVETSTNIPDPTDRDRYKKLFTSLDAVKELGITEESLTLTVDRLTSSREKEEQAQELKELLSEAKKHQEKGDVSKALELLDNKVKEVKLKDKGTEFSKLLKATTESEIRERQANKPESLNSGYNIGGEPLLLPSGAISILTAPTSHGKTTFLINLALNIAKEYTDKEVYLFSYEEDGDAILINAFNAYLDHALSAKNRRILQSYFTTGSTEYIKDSSIEYFKSEKDKFFRELIESKRLNINYSNYDSDTLIEAIRYLHKNTKVGAVFIDYIQLLRLPEGKYKTYSRQEEIKEICIALKDVSVETGLPIILGAQFNRTVANPLHLHPTKIGEAGDIERIANLIVGFWNNNHKVNASEGEQKEIKEKQIDVPDTLYTEILKQRGGRVGLYELLDFNGNEGTIKNNRLYHNSSTPTSNYLK